MKGRGGNLEKKIIIIYTERVRNLTVFSCSPSLPSSVYVKHEPSGEEWFMGEEKMNYVFRRFKAMMSGPCCAEANIYIATIIYPW